MGITDRQETTTAPTLPPVPKAAPDADAATTTQDEAPHRDNPHTPAATDADADAHDATQTIDPPSSQPSRTHQGGNGRVGPYDQVFARVEVRRSPIHGRGLFAAQRIRKGTLIGRYAGPRTRRIGAYALWFTDEEGNVYGISGRNVLRFVNHSRTPNAVFYDEELFALRPIAPGEEITHHYGADWEDT